MQERTGHETLEACVVANADVLLHRWSRMFSGRGLLAMNIRPQLRGAWRVDRAIVGGVETPKEAGDEHFLWFTDEVVITGNADAAWEMPYTVLGSGSPAKIDITRNDRWE